MSKIKEAICRITPDEVKLKLPSFEVAFRDIRERLNCQQKEPKETCYKLTDKVSVCILEEQP